jgi:hypothetical protein
MDVSGTVKTAATVPLVLIAATIVGGLLGGVTDAVALGVIDGTPLGPASPLSPVLWTAIGLGVLYAAAEAID